MRILCAYLLLLCANWVHADGLPYSTDGALHTEALIFTMDDNQFKEVDTRREITLNDDQKYLINKLFKQVPDKLTVVSSAYNDGREDAEHSEVHCIWMGYRTLAITYWLGANEAQRQSFEEQAHFFSVADPKRFVISSEAKVYRDGKELSFADVYRLIDELSKTPPDPREARSNVGVPPTRNRVLVHHPVASIGFSLPPKESWETSEDIEPKSLLVAFQAYAATKQVQVSETW